MKRMEPAWRRFALCGLALALVLGGGVETAAALVQLQSNTLVRHFERDRAGREANNIVPVYEYLQLDWRPKKEGPLSFHLYGWGRTSLADDYFEDKNEAELLYGYFQYRSPVRNYSLRVGRQQIFAGVASDSVDGILLQAALAQDFSVSLYGGLPVSLETTAGSGGDGIAGGRLSWHKSGRHDLGVSYKIISSDGDIDEERLGADLFLTLPRGISLLGVSTRNLESDAWGEHSCEVRIPLGAFEFRPYFQHYRSEGLFSAGDNSYTPFRVLADQEGWTRILGAEGFWYAGEAFELGVRGRRYDYQKRFGDARYLSVSATWKWRILSQVGAEVGRMDGHEENNRYFLGRGYGYLQLSRGFVTADLVYAHYDQPIYQEDRSIFLSLGVGRHFFRKALDFKLSMDYSSDPKYERDYRYLLVASYRLGHND